MVRRRDLVDISDWNYAERAAEYMLCSNCELPIGGTRGDYWHLPMDKVITCPTCGSERLAIVRDVKTIEVVHA